MKLLKLAAIPAALLATSAFAQDVVVDQQVVTQPVAVSTTTYNPEQGVVKNTTTQLVDGTRTVFGTIFHPASISAEASTLGYGANIGWSVNDKTELVAGWDGGDVSDLYGNDFKSHGVRYELEESDFSNPYLGARLHPASNWFTVEAGALFPDNDLTLKTKNHSGHFTVNGTRYDLNDSTNLKGKLEYRNDIAPYLTIGFHPNINNHWGLFGDIGAAYLGKADATVTARAGSTVTNHATGALENASVVAQEAEKNIEDKDYAEWAPIVKLGATYRF